MLTCGVPGYRSTGSARCNGCGIEDACSHRIVCYSMSDRITADLAVRALEPAVAFVAPPTPIHSDRGSQVGSIDRRNTSSSRSARWFIVSGQKIKRCLHRCGCPVHRRISARCSGCSESRSPGTLISEATIAVGGPIRSGSGGSTALAACRRSI